MTLWVLEFAFVQKKFFKTETLTCPFYIMKCCDSLKKWWCFCVVYFITSSTRNFCLKLALSKKKRGAIPHVRFPQGAYRQIWHVPLRLFHQISLSHPLPIGPSSRIRNSSWLLWESFETGKTRLRLFLSLLPQSCFISYCAVTLNENKKNI